MQGKKKRKKDQCLRMRLSVQSGEVLGKVCSHLSHSIKLNNHLMEKNAHSKAIKGE